MSCLFTPTLYTLYFDANVELVQRPQWYDNTPKKVTSWRCAYSYQLHKHPLLFKPYLEKMYEYGEIPKHPNQTNATWLKLNILFSGLKTANEMGIKYLRICSHDQEIIDRLNWTTENVPYATAVEKADTVTNIAVTIQPPPIMDKECLELYDRIKNQLRKFDQVECVCIHHDDNPCKKDVRNELNRVLLPWQSYRRRINF